MCLSVCPEEGLCLVAGSDLTLTPRVVCCCCCPLPSSLTVVSRTNVSYLAFRTLSAVVDLYCHFFFCQVCSPTQHDLKLENTKTTTKYTKQRSRKMKVWITPRKSRRPSIPISSELQRAAPPRHSTPYPSLSVRFAIVILIATNAIYPFIDG